MNVRDLAIVKLDDGAKLPEKNNQFDLGIDLFALNGSSISPRGRILISTGIAIDFTYLSDDQYRYGGLIKDRSSMANAGIHVMGGVIDPDYQGEIKVILQNMTDDVYEITTHQKIAQLVLTPVFPVNIVQAGGFRIGSPRGDKGFGSSGK